MENEVDIINFRVNVFELVNEVRTGFFKVVGIFCIPKEEKAVWEVADKYGGFISLTGRG